MPYTKQKYLVTTTLLVSIVRHSHSIQSSESILLTRNELSVKRELLRTCRGGSNHNTNYYYSDEDPNLFMPPTLADLDNNQIRRPILHTSTNKYPTANRNTTPPKPLTQILNEYAKKLHLSSPTLYYGSLLSLIIFGIFQIPALLPLIRNHLVCSTINLTNGRVHTLLSSAVTHATVTHLAMNLYAFHLFGKAVLPTLNSNFISLLSFCTLSAITANAFFLLVSPRGASCVGLSGVTLSLLALDAKLHPGKELAFVVRFIPIRLPAQHMLTLLLGWSVLGTVGMLVSGNSGGIAHGTHLGGLLFGIIVYEGLNRGLWRDWRMTSLRLKGRFRRRFVRSKGGRPVSTKKDPRLLTIK